MIRAVAIDDNERMHRSLQRMLAKVEPEVEVVGTATSVEDGVSIIEATQPDLLFLDIDLGKDAQQKPITGFDLLAKITAQDYLIVFITSYGEYARRAMDFEAVAYLDKPLLKEELVEALDRARRRFTNRSTLDREADLRMLIENFQGKRLPTRYTFYADGAYHFLAIDEILYFYKDDTLVWVVCTDGRRFSRTGNLSAYVEHFAPYPQFYRIAQGYLANLKHIVSLSTSRLVTFSDGEEVQVTPQSAAEIRQRLDGL